MGLPKANRLKHRQNFRSVYERGARYSSPYLTLRALPGAKLKPPSPNLPTQIGISVSQKVSKKAVIRNRIKRQIRAAMRELLPTVLEGWRLIIVVHPKAIECNYEHFLRELKQLLIKAEVMNGHSRRHIL